jgi:YspA, cpYpsA-related SLOG family
LRVLVCGSRTWDDADEIRKVLERFGRETTIVHGGARGADTIAAGVAHALGMQVEEYPADFELHGRPAGIIRNIEMIETEPDLVVAFWDGVSTGTKHTLSLAKKNRIPIEIHLS